MALDRLFISIKLGDNLPYLDCMVIDYFDELETRVDFYKALTPDCSKKFRFIQIDRALKPKIIELLAPIGYSKILGPLGEPLPDPDKYRVRGGILAIDELCRLAGKTATAVRDQTLPFAPINGLSLSPDKLISSALVPVTVQVPDRAAITDGPCSIGAGGAAPNYLTWALFGSDVGDLTGGKAIVATQCAATAETAQCAISKALNGGSITVTSAVNPKGNFGAGYLTTKPATGANGWMAFILTSTTAGAKLIISNLNIKALGADGGYSIICISTSGTNTVNTVKDCLFNVNGYQNNCLRPSNASCIINVFNCVFILNTTSIGWFPVGIYASSIIENCTSYGPSHTTYGGFCNYSNAAYTAKNIVSFGSTVGKDYTYGSLAGLGATVASKCASSDATGSETALRNLVAANQFSSLTLADGDPFLKLKGGSALLGSGVAPSIAANTYGIRSNLRPHGGLYSIGADEWKANAMVPPGIF